MKVRDITKLKLNPFLKCQHQTGKKVKEIIIENKFHMPQTCDLALNLAVKVKQGIWIKTIQLIQTKNIF